MKLLKTLVDQIFNMANELDKVPLPELESTILPRLKWLVKRLEEKIQNLKN